MPARRASRRTRTGSDETNRVLVYAKFMLNGSGTSLSAFEIGYPQAQKAGLLVEQMEDSLTARG